MSPDNLIDKNIVIIDDSDTWCTLMSRCLEQKKCRVKYYRNQLKYISYLKENGPDFCPDCVIVDYHLKSGTAPEVIKQIREVCENTLILSVSGDFKDENDNLKTDKMIETLNAGANRAIPKNPENIMHIMNMHFEVRKNLYALDT